MLQDQEMFKKFKADIADTKVHTIKKKLTVYATLSTHSVAQHANMAELIP